jgi:hypothetical protein
MFPLYSVLHTTHAQRKCYSTDADALLVRGWCVNRGVWIKSTSWRYESSLNIIPLKPKIVYIIHKNSVRTAKKAQHFTVTKINRLTLFKKIIAICSKKHMKRINTNVRWLIIEAGGTYSYRWALKGYSTSQRLQWSTITSLIGTFNCLSW